MRSRSYSPFTIAAEGAALLIAADVADAAATTTAATCEKPRTPGTPASNDGRT
jgi:hypothetical protein